MYKKYFFYLLLILPNIGYCLSCSPVPLVAQLLFENRIIVSFKVIDHQVSDSLTNSFINIQIIEGFNSNEIDNQKLTIDLSPLWGGSANDFKINSVKLGALNKGENSFSFPICTPVLTIDNGIIIEKTGIDILDNLDTPVTTELFSLAVKAYQQGLSHADTVCQSPSQYCSKRTKYDINTGILDLPSISYSFAGISAYAKAKLKKTGDNPITFTVTDLDN